MSKPIDANLATLRHTASHVLAQAVLQLFPEATLAIGPSTAEGFYYDFDLPRTLSTEDLATIAAQMKAIVKQNLPLERREMSREEANAFFVDQPYKLELISELPADAVISAYTQGDFTDLCAGPHAMRTGNVKAFALLSVAGAYWRGSEKNKMLQRIYGTAFATRQELDDYLKMLEESKARDHRKLGRELDLYSILEEGPGFPFFHPKGMILRNELETYWRQLHTAAGYEEIKSPIILNQELWHRSGHWDHYKENMYTTKIDEVDFAVKPMNCPGGMLMYKRRIWSYRDLPIRTGELGLVHRHELSGALHGLMRVRCFTQDDAHIFMTPEQVPAEIGGVIDLMQQVYTAFGFTYHVELSTQPENSMGDKADWDRATDALRNALEERGMEYVINEGDGAFYGPKIDFHLRDCIGRTWQCGTIQLDFQMPERFDLTYVGNDNQKHRPVMIHRVVFGSIERFIGILTEHFAGAFPVWLAPVQARIMTITDRADEAAQKLCDQLTAAGVRVEMDLRNEKIGFKVREAREQRIPYMLTIGDREAENATVAVRRRGEGDLGVMEFATLVERIVADVQAKKMD